MAPTPYLLRLAAVAWLLALGFAGLHWYCDVSGQPITVRWAPSVTDDARRTIERSLGLVDGESREERTWSYLLTDRSRDTISALVNDPLVEDTHHIDRTAFRVQLDRPDMPAWLVDLAETGHLDAVAVFFGLIGFVATWSRRRTLVESVRPLLVRAQRPDAYTSIAILIVSLYICAEAAAAFTSIRGDYLFGLTQIPFGGWLLLFVLIASSPTIVKTGVFDGLSAGVQSLPARVIASIALGGLFFVMRTRFINEDGRLFADKFRIDIPIRGAHLTHDEMWELWIHSKAWIVTNQYFGWTVEHSYQVVSCVAGAVFVFVLLRYCLELWPKKAAAAFVLCMSAGYVQLFFGDVENYTMTAAWIMGYLLASLLFLTGRWSVVVPSLLIAAALTFHLQAGFLLPSWLYLLAIAWTRHQRGQVVAACAGAGAIVAGTLAFFHFHGLPLTALYSDSHAFGHGGDVLGMLVTPSVDHYIQLANLVVLLAPASLLLVPLALGRRIPLDPINVHLLLAVAFMGVFVVSWDPLLGVYNDWNLFATAAIPVTMLAWRNVLAIDALKDRAGPVIAVGLLFLVHSLSWIAANHYL